MYPESDLLPLSGLQHLAFGERQCGLIHLELIWEENRLTVEGRHLHERVHEAEDEVRDGVRIVRGLRLRSLQLGLIGQADVVEFPLDGGSPVPVEYKRGRKKPDQTDEAQVCAQALCLEEMLETPIPRGFLYYGQPRRRVQVLFDENLRARVATLAARMHELFDAGRTPPAQYNSKCDACSLIEVCMPKISDGKDRARAYIDQLWSGGDSG